jgi:hypothetical protein
MSDHYSNSGALSGVDCDVVNCKYHNGKDNCLASCIKVGAHNALRTGETFCGTFSPATASNSTQSSSRVDGSYSSNQAGSYFKGGVGSQKSRFGQSSSSNLGGGPGRSHSSFNSGNMGDIGPVSGLGNTSSNFSSSNASWSGSFNPRKSEKNKKRNESKEIEDYSDRM